MLGIIPFIIVLAVASLCVCVSAAINKLKVRQRIRRALVRVSYSVALGMVCASCLRANMSSFIELAEKYFCCDSAGNFRLCVQWAFGWEYLAAFRLVCLIVFVVMDTIPVLSRGVELCSHGSSVSTEAGVNCPFVRRDVLSYCRVQPVHRLFLKFIS